MSRPRAHSPIGSLRAPPTPRPPAGLFGPGAFLQNLYATGPYRPYALRGWALTPLARADIVLAMVLAASAMWVRQPFIVHGESLLHSDEAIVGLMAQDIADGTRYPIYFYGQRYMGALEAYVVAGLRHLLDDPVVALRSGPACFFALLVAVQFLMLTRWYGRLAGLVAAASLLAAPPMFVQWSVAARGGYIEILLWGSAAMWAYAEWFVARSDPAGPRRRFLFGAILGSGMWINPSIIVFALPIAMHAFLARVWPIIRAGPDVSRFVGRLGPLALPVFAASAIALTSLVHCVWVEDGRIRRLTLLGVLPPAIAKLVIGLAVAGGAFALLRHRELREHVRTALARSAGLVFGIVAGATPAIVYLVGGAVGRYALDPSLPLGLRPFWKCGATLAYLFDGLPMLFAADARTYLDLVLLGRDSPLRPLPLDVSLAVSAADVLVGGAMLTIAAALLVRYRSEFVRLLSLRGGTCAPVMIPALGAVTLIGLFLLSGAAVDINSVRYLVPIWAFVPGLMAAAVSTRRRPRLGAAAMALPARFATVLVLLAWTYGQSAMAAQLGQPHPLRRAADTLAGRSTGTATAEIFDAHVLSFLTGQRCRVAEYRPFWSRLAHYRATEADRAVQRRTFVVETRPGDWLSDWRRLRLPGDPPPETHRTLWPRIERYLRGQPDALESIERLDDRFSLVRLRHPLPPESRISALP